MKPELLQWLAGHDTGLSSKAILAHMEHNEVIQAMNGTWGMAHPLDPADLGRCIRLMDIEPSYRDRIIEMAYYSKEWARLALHWGELEALYHEEVSDHRGRAPRTYARMQELLKKRTVSSGAEEI